MTKTETIETHRCLACTQEITARRGDVTPFQEHKRTAHPRMRKQLFFSLVSENQEAAPQEKNSWLGPQWEDQFASNEGRPAALLYLVPGSEYPSPVVMFAQGANWKNWVTFQRDWSCESSQDRELYYGHDTAVVAQWIRGAEIAQTIVADILARPVRRTSSGEKANLLHCASFSELHDYCDANVLGDQEKLLDEYGPTDGPDEEENDAARNKAVDVLNCAQEIVDTWLKARLYQEAK